MAGTRRNSRNEFARAASLIQKSRKCSCCIMLLPHAPGHPEQPSGKGSRAYRHSPSGLATSHQILWRAHALLRMTAKKRTSLECPGEENFRVLAYQVFLLQSTLRPVPLVDPVDHAQQREGRCPWADYSLGLPRALQLGDQALHEMYIVFLARVDAASQRRRQGMVFVQHHRDLAVAHAEDDFDMQADQHAQAFFRVGDVTHRIDYPLLGDVHGVIHQIEQDLVFALEMVVEAALAQLERSGHVVHGSRVVALLLEEASGSAQDLLAGVDRGLTSHSRTAYTVRNGNANREPNFDLDSVWRRSLGLRN